ncbi:unnamed protein product [Linum tenue]|uniref:Protein kinase domain-containing protein n=1 Tax=Linum tenue TaxID=586396 RepID=A0AAV0LP87_9ROSI|nr:unnamed protein product [Linum tenue]
MEECRRGLLRLVLLIWVLIRCAAAQQRSVLLSSRVEWRALIDLRGSLGIRSSDWPIKSDPCANWKGVQCGGDGRVTGINVSGFRRTRVGRLNPGFSVDAMANFTSLEVFNASGFALPGSIPDWFGSQFGSSLRVLDLRASSVTGPIPATLGELTQLNALYLSENQLAGALPSTLGQLSRMSILDLSRNLLTGSIPWSLASLRNLSSLNLSSNYLSGSIPPGFGNISMLKSLDLSDNSLAGSIPDDFGALSQLVDLNLSKNSLSGSLPDGLSKLNNLQKMVISSNELDGRLPSALFALPDLQIVDVSGNNFTGDVQSISFNGNAAGSAALNLSNNLLYGALSSQFDNSSSVDLSGNYIQGKVVNGGRTPRNVVLSLNCLEAVSDQRSLEDCRMFYSRRGLSFDDFGAPLPSQEFNPRRSRSKQWIYILVGVVGAIGFILVLAIVMVLFLRKFDRNRSSPRGSANVGPVPEGDNNNDPPSVAKDLAFISGIGESFPYEQLSNLTSDLADKNLIKHGHSGDLFQSLLEGGSPIVVKRIDSRSAKKELVELEFFSKYSHARLVPLLGHCLENENEKFLVYKYMVNGDLASSLHKVSNVDEEDRLKSLDWITRLKIATGAAEGLCYLHHECNPPVVHRDVQASSILLDDKFEVRLGSLSSVHVQEGPESHHNKIITRFLRKQLSSEAGGSRGGLMATCAHDVYCFGKVLLELVTGKLGISNKSDDATIRDWLDQTLPYISIYDKELVTKIVDPSMMVDEDLLEEVWAMAIIARSCLNPKPSKRPPMKYILKALENPMKVVRADSYGSGRLRTTSSRRSSWSSAFFGSWRHSSSENAVAVGGSKQPVRIGSHNSGRIGYSKRLSNEIFPEPLEIQDIERQEPDYEH